MVGPLSMNKDSFYVKKLTGLGTSIKLKQIFVFKSPIKFFNVRMHYYFRQISEFIGFVEFETRNY